jgi:uncharacterized protein YbjT (DUF2867 family)
VRWLIVGCGCRGLALASVLRHQGHAVRGTTRDPDRAPALERAGVEPFVADPDRVGTLTPALEHVGGLALLLGSAVGEPERVEALHGTRLEMLLSKVIDTTVRVVVYEAAGSAPADVLAGGSELVREACERSRIDYALLRADPADSDAWLAAALSALAPPR